MTGMRYWVCGLEPEAGINKEMKVIVIVIMGVKFKVHSDCLSRLSTLR